MSLNHRGPERRAVVGGIVAVLLLVATARGLRADYPLTTADLVRFLRAGVSEHTIMTELQARGFSQALLWETGPLRFSPGHTSRIRAEGLPGAGRTAALYWKYPFTSTIRWTVVPAGCPTKAAIPPLALSEMTALLARVCPAT